MNKKKIDKVVSTLGVWCATIGLPLCVIGVEIVIFFGVFGREQVIGTFMVAYGVIITSLTLPLICIKLIVNHDALVSGEKHE